MYKKYLPSKNKSKNFKKIAIFLIILLLITIVPARGVFQSAKDASRHGKALSEAYKSQNFDEIKRETEEVKVSVESMDRWLGLLFWMRLIPVIGGYYSDAKGFSSAGVEELTATLKILKQLEGSKSELGFNNQPIGGQERISQALKILDKTLPNIHTVEENFKKARENVEGIDTNKYPKNFRGIHLRDQLTAAKNFIIGIDIAVTEAKPVLEVAPSLLGLSSPKTYLMLFQNDKEIRATGGFMTAYAVMKLDKGQIGATSSDDIYRLDEKLLNTCLSKVCPLTPPAPIVKYLPETTGKARTTWSMRDSNLSPDLPTSAKEFERIYRLLGEGFPFDGIIFIDTQVVEELIEVTGPIDVYGNKFSSEIDKRCNCPNVIYELESYAEIAAKGEKDRKAILGVLMQQILSKVIEAEPDKIPLFLDTIVRLANHKHIMFYIQDSKSQQALGLLNWTGEIHSFDGDYLHINDSNFAGGKSNLYVDQTVTQDISKNGNSIKKKITIEYKNPQPFNIWLNGINRDYVRVYVPKGSKLLSSKGSDNPVTTIEDLGKTVFEAFVQVRPQNSRKLELEYEVPYKPEGDYKILIQKQPGAKDFRYIIKSSGVTKEDLRLDADKEFKFRI